jgi:hypothetical protein
MAIEQYSKPGPDFSRYGEEYWTVRCDGCKSCLASSEKYLSVPTTALTPGDASDMARRHGYVTVPNGSQPSKWLCVGCQQPGKK